ERGIMASQLLRRVLHIDPGRRKAMLKRFTSAAGAVALALASLPALAADSKLDLKQAVPADVFMAVYGKSNPEREYQQEYCQEIWDTIREERIGRRIVDLIGSRISEDK